MNQHLHIEDVKHLREAACRKLTERALAEMQNRVSENLVVTWRTGTRSLVPLVSERKEGWKKKKTEEEKETKKGKCEAGTNQRHQVASLTSVLTVLICVSEITLQSCVSRVTDKLMTTTHLLILRSFFNELTSNKGSPQSPYSVDVVHVIC